MDETLLSRPDCHPQVLTTMKYGYLGMGKRLSSDRYISARTAYEETTFLHVEYSLIEKKKKQKRP